MGLEGVYGCWSNNIKITPLTMLCIGFRRKKVQFRDVDSESADAYLGVSICLSPFFVMDGDMGY